MLLSGKTKLVWIGTIATAAIVAITLGITLPPTTSISNEINIGTARSTGSDNIDSPGEAYYDLPPEISCPCFAASSLDSVITSVRDGSVTLNNGSCVETKYGKKISYTFDAQGYSEYGSWGVGTFDLDWTCQHADTIRPGLSDEEYNACKTIVDDACTELEM